MILSTTFNLAHLMLLEQATWRKGKTLADPPTDFPKLDDNERLTLSLKVGGALIEEDETERAGDFTAVSLTWRETMHLIQGINIYDESAGEPVGLDTLVKLYRLLAGYEADTAVANLGYKDAEEGHDITYKDASKDQTSGGTEDGPRTEV